MRRRLLSYAKEARVSVGGPIRTRVVLALEACDPSFIRRAIERPKHQQAATKIEPGANNKTDKLGGPIRRGQNQAVVFAAATSSGTSDAFLGSGPPSGGTGCRDRIRRGACVVPAQSGLGLRASFVRQRLHA